MSNQIKLMNQYVADLAVLNTKFHNLHWNVTGERFVPIHVHLEELYDDLFEKYDEVAERIKMLGEFPLASQKSYLEVTNVKELEVRDYKIGETMKIVKDEVVALKELADSIRTAADEVNDYITVAMMEDHVAGYDKELWFIAQMLK
ncbi:MAG: Dps family protein [Candidatus Izemoplasmataceae bacterium]|jgi:starvation-inducible DNA-binding protein|uniref:Dps family protein n=1 Tax=Liberiplasma polymorphum TaxID=3374570 RepID=UPI0037759586